MQFFPDASDTGTGRNVLAEMLITCLAVIAATAFPRLMLIGGLPATDEGVYAYHAQLMYSTLSSGLGLPDSGTLALYPFLLCWTFGAAANHMILLRGCDLAVALLASWLLCRVLQRESASLIGGALIALLALFAMNQPLFIQNGFKNSMFAGMLPLLLALRLAQVQPTVGRGRWLWIGALSSLAVLLRETFIPFFVVGALAVLIARGWRTALSFAMGAALCGTFILGLMTLARGDFHGLLDAYREAGVVYASLSSQRLPFFLDNGLASAREAWVILSVAGVATIPVAWSLVRRDGATHWGQAIFWLSVALVPLIEPASKIGFPYHFSASLPGAAGLAAVGWKCFTGSGVHRPSRRILATATLVFAALLVTPKAVTLASSWPSTRHALESAGTGRWPADAISQSNYLVAAQEIRRVAAPGSTLSVSGFMFALYPLTGLLPATSKMSNLTATLIGMDLDGARLRNALRACPPEILMTTTRTDWPGSEVLGNAVTESGLYEQVGVVPVADDKQYGGFGGIVYKRTSNTGSPCRLVHGDLPNG